MKHFSTQEIELVIFKYVRGTQGLNTRRFVPSLGLIIRKKTTKQTTVNRLEKPKLKSPILPK